MEDREFELAWDTERPPPPNPKGKERGGEKGQQERKILSGFISKRVVSNRKKETKISGQSKRGGGSAHRELIHTNQ